MEETKLIEQLSISRKDILVKVPMTGEDALILKGIIGKSKGIQIHKDVKGFILRTINGEVFDISKYKNPIDFVVAESFSRKNFNYPGVRFPFFKGTVMILEKKRKKPGFFVEFPGIGDVWWPSHSVMEFLKPIYYYDLEKRN